ncbi:hypothetical protein NQ317_000576 [Molorchus minor]|uniref:Uncharacterized protein n=1 Tax=Molorchus minor TaxID=1323400 RepID=A0ABQ9IY35_9CUCU|nr:hypothetical protein NQ317_000576 [Molorchus minor]
MVAPPFNVLNTKCYNSIPSRGSLWIPIKNVVVVVVVILGQLSLSAYLLPLQLTGAKDVMSQPSVSCALSQEVRRRFFNAPTGDALDM